jgi:acetyltransferase-like isoleucine patch superfamily enzyme
VIKNNSFIGVNASIRDNIVIGKECIIGAGSVILRNVQDFSILSPGSTEVSKIKSNQL